MTSPARISAACAVLVAIFVVALLVGRGSADTGEPAATPAEVKALALPVGSVKAPKLADTGAVPDLQPKPQAPSTPSTSSTPAADVPSSTPSTGSTGSTGGSGGGGGGSTPPPPPPQ